MLHKSRGLWWWVLVVVVVVVTRTGAQKIDADGLEEDKYNLVRDKGQDVDDRTKQKATDKEEVKYMVTEEVYFDVTIGGKTKKEEPTKGRITIACFGEITPITCLNFVALAKGHKKGRDVLTYKDTPIHRIVKDFVIQMGDVTGKKGKSGKSIYGDKFQDENFVLSHRGAGWVSMANHGRDSNGSQFFILLQPARWLDGRHVAFGKVIKGMDIVRKIAELDTTITGKPKVSVRVVDSGVMEIPSKYEMTAKDALSSDDISN
ncbi:peptidyl-prolyl cis-trans isomerase B-like [Babylonia areolata]|uniref:peptidyl-prolyl cis-trans isomerase B-like n=1 Tax=Babylonia areolata TaxID=304850 RepID=UPI003FCFE0A5